MVITIQKHEWQQSQTNEYCVHCGLIFESDLSWTSADRVNCIVRPIENESDFPAEIKSYATFRGLRWNKLTKTYNKSYASKSYTLEDIQNILNELCPK